MIVAIVVGALHGLLPLAVGGAFGLGARKTLELVHRRRLLAAHDADTRRGTVYRAM